MKPSFRVLAHVKAKVKKKNYIWSQTGLVPFPFKKLLLFFLNLCLTLILSVFEICLSLCVPSPRANEFPSCHLRSLTAQRYNYIINYMKYAFNVPIRGH